MGWLGAIGLLVAVVYVLKAWLPARARWRAAREEGDEDRSVLYARDVARGAWVVGIVGGVGAVLGMVWLVGYLRAKASADEAQAKWDSITRDMAANHAAVQAKAERDRAETVAAAQQAAIAEDVAHIRSIENMTLKDRLAAIAKMCTDDYCDDDAIEEMTKYTPPSEAAAVKAAIKRASAARDATIEKSMEASRDQFAAEAFQTLLDAYESPRGARAIGPHKTTLHFDMTVCNAQEMHDIGEHVDFDKANAIGFTRIECIDEFGLESGSVTFK